jgi:hypothetical protein
MNTPKKRRPTFTATIRLSVAGLVVSGGFMFLGTLLLGHIRPMWMEFDYTLPSALVALLVGSVLGLIVDYQRWKASA